MPCTCLDMAATLPRLSWLVEQGVMYLRPGLHGLSAFRIGPICPLKAGAEAATQAENHTKMVHRNLLDTAQTAWLNAVAAAL